MEKGRKYVKWEEEEIIWQKCIGFFFTPYPVALSAKQLNFYHILLSYANAVLTNKDDEIRVK